MDYPKRFYTRYCAMKRDFIVDYDAIAESMRINSQYSKRPGFLRDYEERAIQELEAFRALPPKVQNAIYLHDRAIDNNDSELRRSAITALIEFRPAFVTTASYHNQFALQAITLIHAGQPVPAETWARSRAVLKPLNTFARAYLTNPKLVEKAA